MAKPDRRFKYQSEADKPVMLTVRVPRELLGRLERYAREHRQPVSELVRDALEMRLEVDADPRSRRDVSTTVSTTVEREYQIDGASILREMQAHLARHDTQMHALMQAIERQSAPEGTGLPDEVSYDVIHGMTAIEPEGQEQPAEQEPASDAALSPALAEDTPASNNDVPAYDTATRVLGKLCPRGHAHPGTEQSLLSRRNNGCLECEKEKSREKREAKRQALAP